MYMSVRQRRDRERTTRHEVGKEERRNQITNVRRVTKLIKDQGGGDRKAIIPHAERRRAAERKESEIGEARLRGGGEKKQRGF